MHEARNKRLSLQSSPGKAKARAVLRKIGLPRGCIPGLSELLSYKIATALYQTATREK
jgi:hypothetical protein